MLGIVFLFVGDCMEGVGVVDDVGDFQHGVAEVFGDLGDVWVLLGGHRGSLGWNL